MRRASHRVTDVAVVAGAALPSVSNQHVEAGMVGLLAVGLWSAVASAADQDRDFKSPEEFDAFLDEIGDPQPGTSPQFAPDTTEIWGPKDPKSGLPGLVGHISTETEYPAWPYGEVIETWIVYRPEVTLTGEMLGHFVGSTPGGLAGLEAHYAGLPNASSYRELSFDFTYQYPLTSAQVAEAPGFVPWFVDEVYQFAVYTVIDGVERRSGSLYRQRVVFGGFVSWWDEWVLFDTYEMPDSAHVVTRLEPTGAPTVPLRTWLEAQPANQKAFVHTTATEAPL